MNVKSSSGEKVTKRDQAIAIAISGAESEGLESAKTEKRVYEEQEGLSYVIIKTFLIFLF